MIDAVMLLLIGITCKIESTLQSYYNQPPLLYTYFHKVFKNKKTRRSILE